MTSVWKSWPGIRFLSLALYFFIMFRDSNLKGKTYPLLQLLQAATNTISYFLPLNFSRGHKKKKKIRQKSTEKTVSTNRTCWCSFLKLDTNCSSHYHPGLSSDKHLPQHPREFNRTAKSTIFFPPSQFWSMLHGSLDFWTLQNVIILHCSTAELQVIIFRHRPQTLIF